MFPATYQKIDKIIEHTNSDNLEIAQVLGWTTVIKKGQFKAGDTCVFVVVDSVLPDADWCEFMRSNKFRVKSQKIRKALSQGIAFSPEILTQYMGLDEIGELEIGADLSEILGVKHYEKPTSGFKSGDAAGNFPEYIPKTDEERIQNCLGVIKELANVPCVITTKVDGTSATFGIQNDKIDVCSRNLSVTEGNNIYWEMAHKYNILDILKEAQKFAIQGEIAGPGIQGNKLQLKEHELFVFNVRNLESNRYLDHQGMGMFCEQYQLPMVPFEGFYTFTGEETLEDLLEMAEGKYQDTNNHKEGIVIRPKTEMYSKVLFGRTSFKVVNNKFLLKHGE